MSGFFSDLEDLGKSLVRNIADKPDPPALPPPPPPPTSQQFWAVRIGAGALAFFLGFMVTRS